MTPATFNHLLEVAAISSHPKPVGRAGYQRVRARIDLALLRPAKAVRRRSCAARSISQSHAVLEGASWFDFPSNLGPRAEAADWT